MVAFAISDSIDSKQASGLEHQFRFDRYSQQRDNVPLRSSRF